MRILAFIVGVGAAVCLVVVLSGDRLLSSRFNVGTFVYEIPDNAGATNEEVMRAGLWWALGQGKLDANAWVIPSSKNWQRANDHPAEGGRVVILLSNKVDGTSIFAHIEATKNKSALKYQLSRAK